MATPAHTIGPNEIADLSVARLILDQEWLAVAAYAKAAPNELRGTLEHLAGACDQTAAFAWFWALVTRPDSPDPEAGWSAFQQLPTLVGVPSDLSDAVIAFVAAPAGPIASRATAAGLLLRRLRGRLAQKASRAVLDAHEDEETAPSRQAADEAIAVLSQLRVPADRARVLRALRSRPASERLPLLLNMSAPFTAEEVAELQAALQESLVTTNPALVPQMHEAWRQLTVAGQRAILVNQVAAASDRCRAFLTPDLLAPLGVPQVLEFLVDRGTATGLNPAVAAGVIEDLASTGHAFGLALLEGAHGQLDEATLRAASLRVLQAAASWDRSLRIIGLATVMRPAIREADPIIGDAMLQAVPPDDLSEVVAAVRPRTAEQARHLGTWLHRYLAEGPTRAGQTGTQSAIERSSSVAAALRSLPKRWRDAAASAVAETETGILPAAVADVFVADVALAAVCATGGSGSSLLEAMRREDSIPLDAPDRCAVLLIVAAREPSEPVAEEALRTIEEDLPIYDAALGAAQLGERLLHALADRPALLVRHVVRQLETLDRPQGEAAPPERLAPVLAGALDRGLVSAVAQAAPHIRRLVSGHKLLHPLAANWLAAAPPTAELVDICVDADEHYARRSPYPAARIAQAETLASRVADIGLETDARVAALSSAARADPRAGRDAALAVPSDYPVALRRAAAKVLADTPGASGDVDRLTELADGEDDAEALGLLQTAIRRVHSGDVGEALEHLLSLVDLDLDPARVTTSVLLPDARLHAAFIAKVDNARGSLSGPPAVAVNSLIDLGEVLAEWAIGFTFRMSAKNADDGRRLLENAPNKPGIGDLVRRQSLLQELPWLASYAALRDDRSIHVAPAGTTVPVAVVDESVVAALHLTRKVVKGWIDVMYVVEAGRS